MNKYWEYKTLEEFSHEEWESLCDGCGLCCLVRVEDEDTNEIFPTNIVCSQYDCTGKKCKNYTKRKKIVSDCIILTPELVREFDWLPDSCAYRLILKGKQLPENPPLISGHSKNTQTIVDFFSEEKLIPYSDDIDLEDHVIVLLDNIIN